MPQTKKIFISYSHKDEKWKDLLVKHLEVLEQEGLISVWDDSKLQAGLDWAPEIKKNLNEASIAILMISPAFLDSNFILKKEIPIILERRQKEGLIVFLFIVARCGWTRIKWLSPIQGFPKGAKSFSEYPDNEMDSILIEFVKEIRNLLDKIGTVEPIESSTIPQKKAPKSKAKKRNRDQQ